MIQVLLNEPDDFLIPEEYKCGGEATEGKRMMISTKIEAYKCLSKP